MPRARKEEKRRLRLSILLLVLAAPVGAFAGISAQGISAQGISAQGISAQGISAQGISAQGISAQGISAQGISAQGISAQGISAQGISAQGISAQGISAQGISAQGISAQGISAQGKSLIGTDLIAQDGRGVEISSVKIRGLTPGSGPASYVLTNIPMASAGPGNYISLTSGLTPSAAGHYAVAHLVDAVGMAAEDLDLYIASEQKDPIPNLFHRFEEQQNQDELYVVYYFHKVSGQWISLCPYNAATKSASAMALPVDDPTDPQRFIFACTATGVASKCARNWGYKPWGQTDTWEYDALANGGLGAWNLETFPLKPYYEICVAAAQASYCQDGRSYTKNGTLVDLFDTRQIIWPNAIENPFSSSNNDSLWMMAQEYFISQDPSPLVSSMKDSALQRTRYRELSPIGECSNLSYVGRLEHDHIEDGRWASPLTNTPRLQVFSPTYCSHDEYHDGEALPWDCSPCTTQVCKSMPGCCGAGATPGWTAACVAQATTVCQDGGVQWPAGKVWPRDLPNDDHSIYPTYLLGPSGAVLRADGTSASGSSATISGWACDPEWAGTSVAIRVYAGGPAEEGGTFIGEARADQALATPLAREVSAACDGPGRSYARHGFSFTLPMDQSGDVYVYALDDSTANGPAAPATLLRNGVVRVPRCEHSEHLAGEALSASCSTCAASICGDETHGTCCTTAWTDECAAAADACASADSSALANSRSFAAVTTGWIEAPVSGSYVFEASQQPSRLLVNGLKVLDWFETSPGTTSGSITLAAGQKYHLRWDRFQASPPGGTPGPGLTWQLPGTVGQTPIPSANLYALAPATATGLTATYFTSTGFGGSSVTRTDVNVDINKDIAPPGPPPQDLPSGYGPSYSARWEGEIVPSFTEDHTFYVVGSGTATLNIDSVAISFPPPPGSSAPGGCAHDLCVLGDKLDASCNSCVHDICQKDSYCCDGGYLSYYSVEPVWDARCVAEVETYCPGSKCTTPMPSPGSPQKKSVTVALQAGVHYRFRFEYSNPTGDKTIRLLWSSARQAKQAIPQYAFRPGTAAASNVGAGLNVTYFATTKVGDVVKPDLNVPLAGGAVADLSLTPAIGQLGVPLVDVLASPVDSTSGRPSPPTIARPRYGEEVFVGGSMTVHVTGIGGVKDGWVRVVGGGSGDVDVPVAANGTFDAPVPLSTGTHLLKLAQYTFQPGAACVPPNPCTRSMALEWPITVTLETASPKAPVILSPTDPTHSPNPAPTAFTVVGRGTSGLVHVEDQAAIVPVVLPDIIADPDGTFSGQVTLEPGTPADPNKGWHKLVFNQGGTPSHPVFVSVGIDPPTVVFPRNGGEIDCDQPDPTSSQVTAIGTLPYPQEVFGRLRVFEETGRQALGVVGAENVVGQQQPGGPLIFISRFSLSPGRHVVYFFQAPDPPAQATQEEKDAHFRAYAGLANTPTSRIVIDQKPPRFPIPPGLAGVLGGLRGTGTIGNFPGVPSQGPFPINITACGPNANPPSPLCAVPSADVNVRVGTRLYTTRADADGAWSLNLPLPAGWSKVTFAQVSDSRVGGAWSESCLSNEIDFGVRQTGGPVINVPPDITVDATSPQGAKVIYPDITAVRATDGSQVPVVCDPPSGSTFGVGRNAVLCTATDPTTGAVGLGEFAITVIDGPPSIKANNLTLEATGPAGTTLNAYTNVSVFDAVDPTPALECVPSVPHLFLLDQTMPVECTVTDSSNQSASAQFSVRVLDTTPPDPCKMKDLKVGTNSGSGAIVNYEVCKASDIVDGSIPMVCDRPSGSLFPLGKTLVKCAATDRHANRSATETFTVEVGDSTPPILKLPGTISAIATSRSGARVSYTVTATDNVDPNPKVKCDPPSGALFPLGKTPVNCTATDAAGNKSTGSFIVKVTVAWSGFLAPVNADGSSRFPLGLPIALRFALTGASANICDLTAKLFVAPLNAAGTPGVERAAAGLPPGAGNIFYFIPIINQYAMLLDTRPLAVGPWQLRVDLGDGEVRTQRITFFKL